jgi:hypothetical protein
MAQALQPALAKDAANAIVPSAERAATALESFRTWLEQRARGVPEETAVGREAYLFFLREVALVPFTPDQLVAAGRQELDRALTFETLALDRSRSIPPLPLLPGVAAVVDRERADEERVRKFYVDRQLLTLPGWLGHYRFRPMPGVPGADGRRRRAGRPHRPGRLEQDGTAYVEAPSDRMGYFQGAAARDPRLQIMHEGAHYLQTALSSANPRLLAGTTTIQVRPRAWPYYDEEMLLQAGLFDDSPRSRDIVYSMMRPARAAGGGGREARAGAIHARPGCGLSRDHPCPWTEPRRAPRLRCSPARPGKPSATRSGSCRSSGSSPMPGSGRARNSGLRDIHDFLFANGYVPVSLLRWEYLGLRDEVDALERLR